METLKLVFYILCSAAFFWIIIFFIYLILNKDDGIDLEQGRINYLSREVERLEKKISKETEGNKCPLDLYSIETEIKSYSASDLKPTENVLSFEKDVALSIQKQFFDPRKHELNEVINDLIEKNKIQSDKFAEKEKMYVEKIRQLEKEVLHQKNRAESFNKYIVCDHDIDDDFEIKGVGYNAKITLEPKVTKKTRKSK